MRARIRRAGTALYPFFRTGSQHFQSLKDEQKHHKLIERYGHNHEKTFSIF